METISLSNLISFSQDDFFINKIFELNGVDRFFEQLKNILKSEDINQFNDEKKLIIELNLLVLSNLSRTEKGCHLIFNLENKDKSGVNFWLFFELFINKKTTNLFKFFGNILSNVTAIKEIRDYLISANFNIIERLIQFIYYPNKEIRVNVMKTIRNLNFEFENNEYLSQIIDPKVKIIFDLIKFLYFFFHLD